VPLAIDELSAALGWPCERTLAATEHARGHPDMAGPMVMLPVPPQAWTIVVRLDRLTTEQRQAVAAVQRERTPMTEEEATTLLAALPCGHDGYAEFRQTHLEAEQNLKLAGVLSSDYDPNHVKVSPEVLYSLRYWTRPDEH
jgi:hypothetical protein